MLVSSMNDRPEKNLNDQSRLPPERAVRRLAIVLVFLLVIIILPFLVAGWYLEPTIESFVSSEWLNHRPGLAAVVTIGLLITDLFLPIPSSVVCTMAGSVLGFGFGLFVCWIGLNLAAGGGFYLAKVLGPRVLTGRQRKAFAQYHSNIERASPWYLVACRAIPIAAEASVMFAGLSKLSAIRFWPAVAGSNLGVAFAFVLLGSLAKQGEFVGLALAISFSLPAGFAAAAFFRRKQDPV
jgi:uncharacterized membrane protein YdjX (TVP38/TMEM64 family)